MLYVIYRANDPELSYRGGQGPIVHLEADLRGTIAWAGQHDLQWSFTLSNAGAIYVEYRCDLGQLNEINWSAVRQISGPAAASRCRTRKANRRNF